VNEVFEAAAELQATCQSRGWKYCFIGGVALQRWGEPRETVDADLSLFVEFGHEEPFIQILLSEFEGRIPNAAGFAKENRVLLLRSSEGVGLDVALAGLPYEALVIERASDFVFPPRIVLRTCSAEDLVVLKAFAARGQDWVDVERIIVRQTGQLDWDYIYDHLRPLVELKDQPEIISELERRRAEFEQ
jgi:hypothetical protein